MRFPEPPIDNDYSPLGKRINARLTLCERRILPDKSHEWLVLHAEENECSYDLSDRMHPKFEYRIEAWKRGGDMKGQPPYEGQSLWIAIPVGPSYEQMTRDGATMNPREQAQYDASMAAYAKYSKLLAELKADENDEQAPAQPPDIQ